jgi:hypothetical protein
MSPALQRKKKARVRESVANARFRMLRNAGGGICLVGALVGVAGTIANSGATHPRGPWVTVCLVGAALAVFCGVLGEAGMRATRAVNVEHARKLRETGWLVQESLGFGNACNYGSGQREREAFRAHYLALARGLDRWDRVLREQRVSGQALRDQVARLVKELETPEGVYDVD